MVIRASQRWTLSLWLLEQLHPGASAQGVQPAVPAAAGPAAVSSVPTLATRPSQGFPGATPEASNAAWSTGAQPQALEAWPRAAMAALAACPEAAVLQDVSSGGWLGRCGGLIHDIQSDTQDACGRRAPRLQAKTLSLSALPVCSCFFSPFLMYSQL
eukprot:TRINITY_DN18704_c0_g1_i3.p2 TRINITY_DN18704_c0_g1~~TRINITY_DN18704_c0_g1_i3.p2  ORF type:complete len:157 (+),score=9.36 TRINITY_DN18704_c0_g1_i3:71-541(+)